MILFCTYYSVLTAVDAERTNTPSYDHLDVIKDENRSSAQMGSTNSLPNYMQPTYHGSYIKLHSNVSMHNLIGSTGAVQSSPSYSCLTNTDL